MTITINQEMIQKHWNQYKTSYENKFNETPQSWFTYLQWLANCPGIGNFTPEEIEYTKFIMGAK